MNKKTRIKKRFCKISDSAGAINSSCSSCKGVYAACRQLLVDGLRSPSNGGSSDASNVTVQPPSKEEGTVQHARTEFRMLTILKKETSRALNGLVLSPFALGFVVSMYPFI